MWTVVYFDQHLVLRTQSKYAFFTFMYEKHKKGQKEQKERKMTQKMCVWA